MNELAREHLERGLEAQREGRLEEACDHYRRSLGVEPTAEAHTLLGWAYSFQGRLEDAIEECRLAIDVDPGFGNPYNDIGAYLIELGRGDEAIPWLRKATSAPRYEPRHFPHANLARVYKARFEYDKAARELEKALELEPDYAHARRELAGLRARMN
jgi:Tfp pilus assembly protein PilF